MPVAFTMFCTLMMHMPPCCHVLTRLQRIEIEKPGVASRLARPDAIMVRRNFNLRSSVSLWHCLSKRKRIGSTMVRTPARRPQILRGHYEIDVPTDDAQNCRWEINSPEWDEMETKRAHPNALWDTHSAPPPSTYSEAHITTILKLTCVI